MIGTIRVVRKYRTTEKVHSEHILPDSIPQALDFESKGLQVRILLGALKINKLQAIQN